MQLPASFLALAADGRFDYWGGRTHQELSAEERTRLFAERRGSVLWLRNIEWSIPPTELHERAYLRPGLHVFAANGAGDSYAFYPAWQRGAAEPPVLLVAAEEPATAVFAPTFAAALYRLWLEEAAYWDANDDGDDREGTLRSWAEIIAPQLDEPHRAELVTLAQNPVVASVNAALEAFVASLPSETIAATLPPTKYNPEFVKGDLAARLYAESITFYQGLVAEGHTRFESAIAETEKNRDAAVAAQATK